MKVTIILPDSAVYKDNVPYSDLDLSSAPTNVHALQWDGEKGWVEFVEDSEFRKPSNEVITALPTWANEALAKWDEAKSAEELARATIVPITPVEPTLAEIVAQLQTEINILKAK